MQLPSRNTRTTRAGCVISSAELIDLARTAALRIKMADAPLLALVHVSLSPPTATPRLSRCPTAHVHVVATSLQVSWSQLSLLNHLYLFKACAYCAHTRVTHTATTRFRLHLHRTNTRPNTSASCAQQPAVRKHRAAYAHAHGSHAKPLHLCVRGALRRLALAQGTKARFGVTVKRRVEPFELWS
jgi:hypothetical protein